MIDDCRLAEAISVLFTVLSTLAWCLGHCICRIEGWQTGLGAFVGISHCVKKANRSFPSCIRMKGFHLLSSIQHHDVKQVNQQK